MNICRNCARSGGHKPCMYSRFLRIRGTCKYYKEKVYSQKEENKINGREEFFKSWRTQK